MNLNTEGSSARKILFSVLVAAVLLGGASFLFISWAVPAYGIDLKIVYSVLIRLFPILIGLILLQIGIILASPTTPESSDSKDSLVPDDYDDPLYALPIEDPTLQKFSTGSYLEPVPPQPLEAIPPPITHSISQTEPLQVPAISNFVPVQPSLHKDEVVEAVPVAQPISVSQSQLGLAPLTQAVLFKDYPYPINEDSEIAELLSPLPETEAMDDPALKVHQTIIEDTFGNRLDSEIESASENHYELSLGVINLPDLQSDAQDVDAGITQAIFQKLDSMAFFYILDEQRIAVILPFHQFQQTKRYFASLLESLHKSFPDSAVQIGFSSLHSRAISKLDLYHEAEIATSLAKEQQGFSLIGYESETGSGIF
ncbi:MAG: hypothetical protein CVV52_13690 [Spirochaetae bacterium HGW-Spirochaetae-8]|jgi:hypothetical protein|nr:MAG: hypothetical protein CVV52_13690 [Spirochaetae bacterium HGW-Spirochaetae-8]